jgi:hypothetical protein
LRCEITVLVYGHDSEFIKSRVPMPLIMPDERFDILLKADIKGTAPYWKEASTGK